MNRLLISVICGLVTITTVTQTQAAKPRLVVGIVVDQLRTDYLEHLRDVFGEQGFKRLMDKGVMLEDVDFKIDGLDRASATAMLYTGAYPSVNGIPAASIYDPVSRTPRPVMIDRGVMGNFTTDTYSPAPLRLSTISDELVIDGLGAPQVYTIATDPAQSLIMTGHAGTSAFWLDDNTGKWATTTYFKEVPRLMTRRNYDHPLSARLDTMKWGRHKFSRADRDVYRMWSRSPLANDEVTDIAIDYLKQIRLGARSGSPTDMLNVGYTVAPWSYDPKADTASDLEDSYIRLDAQLGRLFESIDRYVGLDQTVIFLSSTGYYEDPAMPDARFRIPTGEVSLKRAISLLNAYFSARHGGDSYVDGYHDGYVYLDHKTFDKRNLSITEAAAEARDFLSRMSGVAGAYTLSDILSQGSPALARMRLATDASTAGDIRLEFTPGWTVNDDTRFPVDRQPVRLGSYRTPAFILAPELKPERIGTPVDATAIAPTLANVIRIRAPNGAATAPLGL